MTTYDYVWLCITIYRYVRLLYEPKLNTKNQITARPHPNQETNNEFQNPDCDKYKPTNETNKPDDGETNPKLNKKKPPKRKTKVMHIGDIKMFLAAKKQERDSKLKCLRDNDKNTSNTSKNTPSDRCSTTLHPVQPSPLLHSASGSSIMQRYIGLQKMGTRNPVLIQGQQICVANLFWQFT